MHSKVYIKGKQSGKQEANAVMSQRCQRPHIVRKKYFDYDSNKEVNKTTIRSVQAVSQDYDINLIKRKLHEVKVVNFINQ